MKAIGHLSYGGPEVLEVVELPESEAGPGEILVAVKAAGVNPTDLLRRAGIRMKEMSGEDLPLVPGMDLAGVVLEVGPDAATDLAVGDEVMGMLFPRGSRGAYSERLALPAESLVRVPEGFGLVEAATIPMNGLTARMSLDVLGLPPGSTIGVTGAAGTYGSYVIQQAKAAGLRVIADASPAERGLVQGYGADIVVDRGDDVAARFRQAVPEGLDGLADGAVLNERVAPAVRAGGRVVTVRHYNGDPIGGVAFVPIRVREYATARSKLEEVRQLVIDGALRPRIAATFKAEDAAEAHALLEAGGVRGRFVLTF